LFFIQGDQEELFDAAIQLKTFFLFAFLQYCIM
jgi:hypothetical protein